MTMDKMTKQQALEKARAVMKAKREAKKSQPQAADDLKQVMPPPVLETNESGEIDLNQIDYDKPETIPPNL